MTRKKDDSDEKDWLIWASRGLLAAIALLITYIWAQNSSSNTQSNAQLATAIDTLSKNVHSLEEHLMDSDKRVAIIEGSRAEGMERFKKALEQIDDLRMDANATKARVLNLEELSRGHKRP